MERQVAAATQLDTVRAFADAAHIHLQACRGIHAQRELGVQSAYRTRTRSVLPLYVTNALRDGVGEVGEGDQPGEVVLQLVVGVGHDIRDVRTTAHVHSTAHLERAQWAASREIQIDGQSAVEHGSGCAVGGVDE